MKKHDIHPDNVYNIDEKGIIIGVLIKLKVIYLRKYKKTRITQQGKREWVSLIECISSNGRILSLYIIFKVKALNKDWYNEFKKDSEGTCTVFDRGWTDNELYIK